jgi:hypothetical protein
MMMQVGKGLKAVARKAFEDKVRTLANPTLKTATHTIVGGKVSGVPVNVLMDAVLAAGNSFQQTADKFYVARR